MSNYFTKNNSCCSRKKSGTIVFFFVGIIGICQPAFGQIGDAILALGKTGSSGHHIYFSQRSQQKWSSPMQLSFSDKPEILPTLASNAQGEIWIVWTELAQGGGKLKFRFRQNGKWNTTVLLKTENTSDMAPSIIVDSEGDTWLVWAGTDHQDDDIFFSRWGNGEWTLPGKVNADDNWPDILPQIGLSDIGMPEVTWSGFDGKNYVTFTSNWTGTAWSPEQVLMSKTKIREIDMAAIINELPDFVTDLNQTSIHFSRDGKATTLRLKNK